jgi:hypothetical protein
MPSLSMKTAIDRLDTVLRCINKEIEQWSKKRKNDGKAPRDNITKEDTNTEEDMLETLYAGRCSCAQLHSRHIKLPLGDSEIIAGIELLNVSKTAESKLRKELYREIYESLKYPAIPKSLGEQSGFCSQEKHWLCA